MEPNHIGQVLSALKVSQVYNFCSMFNVDEVLKGTPFSIGYDCYSTQTVDINTAVYKFTDTIISPVFSEEGTILTCDIKDLYTNSKSENPLYNVLYCNDQNIAIFDTNKADNSISFIKFVLNILKKHAPYLDYENRICFCKLNRGYCFHSMIYKSGKWCISAAFSLRNRDYDPMLSFIAYTLRDKLTECDLSQYLLTSDRYHQFLSECIANKIKADEREAQLRAENSSCEYYGYDDERDELDYIIENGGDWIFD